MLPLTAWENFYVIVGSSAGALTGLTVVAVSLGAETRRSGLNEGIQAFTTPTVVHFGVALFISALFSAPWQTLMPPAVLLGCIGVAGMFYTALTMRRQRRMGDTYEPVLEDLIWYVLCPLVAYAVLLVAAILLPGSPVAALFVIGGVLLLLLSLGIHNAWDLVTFIATQPIARQDGPEEQDARDEQQEEQRDTA